MKKYVIIASVGIILILIAAFLGLTYYLEQTIRKEIARGVDETAAIEKIEYKGLRIDLLRLDLRIHSIKLHSTDSKDEIIIDEVTIYDFDNKNRIPRHMHIEMRGININANHELLINIYPYLKDMGYTNIKADLQCVYAYDMIEKGLIIKSFKIDAQKVGNVDLSSRLINLDITKIPSDLENFTLWHLIGALPAAIAGAELTFEDDSLVKRLYKMKAEQQNQSIDQYLHESINQIDKAIGKTKTEKTQKALKAIRDFMKNPVEIKAIIKPEQPVPFLRFLWVKNPMDLIELLQVEITT